MSYTNPGPAVTTGDTRVGLASPGGPGAADTSLVGFYGVTPIVRPASAVQAAVTAVTATVGGVGFVTTAGFTSFVAQVENIRSSLVALGLLKGSA